MNVLGFEAAQDTFDELVGILRCSVLDDYLRGVALLVVNDQNRLREGLTSGCPLESTSGPCSEWHEIIRTSSGRYFSNAAISGALHDVCPPTMAPSLVAAQKSERNVRPC